MNNFKDLTDYINKESGKTAYVCGLGPSLRPYLPLLKNNENNKSSFIISCNEVDIMTNLIPKYWVLSQHVELNIRNMNERVKKYSDTILVHGDSMDTTPRNWIFENVTNEYIGFDQRHFQSQKCTGCPNNCANLIEGRLTIQELLMKITGCQERVGTGHTVMIFMVALSIILGAKNIYILGVDLNYSNGYVDGITTNSFDYAPWMADILRDMDVMRISAESIGSKIFNLSPSSPLKQVLPTIENLQF
jgi:hypothetical protein